MQKVYNDQQVADIKARFRKKIAAMSSRDLQTFLEQMQRKLAILLSPEAGDARHWLGQFASPSVVFTPEELKQFDIVTMTAPQLEQALRTIETRRASRHTTGDAFNAMREQKSAQRENNRQRQQSSQQPAPRQASRANQQSHLAPPRRAQQPARPPRQQFWVNNRGQLGFALQASP